MHLQSHPPWTLNLLGSFRLERDGEVVARFGARREELLLAYLALAPEVAHHRRPVAEALWPQFGPEIGSRNLSYNLWLIRNRLRDLGLPDGIWVSARTLQLNPKVSTDVQRFGDLVVSAAHVADATERIRLLEEALAMYGAGLLPSFPFPWIEPERARLEALYQATVHYLSEALQPEGGLYPLLMAVPPATWRRYQDAPPAAPSSSPPLVAPPVEKPGLLPGDRERLRAFVEAAEPFLAGPDRDFWLARIDDEYEAITALLEEAVKREDRVYGMALAGRLWRYWYVRRKIDEGRLYLEQLLPNSREPVSATHALALHAAGTLALEGGDLIPARRRLEEAFSIWRAINDDVGLVKTLSNLAMVAYQEADYPRAQQLYGQCLEIARRSNDPATLVPRLLNAALVEFQLGHTASARSLFEERLSIVEQTNDQAARAVTLAHLACLDIGDDDPAAARTRADEARTLFQAQGDLAGEAWALRLLGRAAHEDGYFESALELYAQSLEAARVSGSMREVAETLRQLARTHEATGNADEAAELVRQAEELSNAAGDIPGVNQARTLAQEVKAGREDPAVAPPSTGC